MTCQKTDDNTLYEILVCFKEDFKNPTKTLSVAFKSEGDSIKINPFVSHLRVKILGVEHLKDKNSKFLSGKQYFWELMIGKDIIHSDPIKVANLVNQDQPFNITFPVYYSRQILNVTLVQISKKKSRKNRYECSIVLNEINNESTKYALQLMDSESLTAMGTLKLTLQHEFYHNTVDDGTHIFPVFYPKHLHVPTPVELAKKTVEMMENNKTLKKKYSLKLGDPNHRCCIDFVVLEDSVGEITLEGWFKYGPSAAGSGIQVELFLQEPDSYIHTGKWKSYGVVETKNGKATFTVPRNSVSGRTRVSMVVLEDSTCARGNVWVIKKGTPAVVFDLDGTISTHDMELIKALIGGPLNIHYDGEERNGARLCANQWWSLGYLPVYLSGRAGSYYELTRNWLEKHNFPPGLIGHTLDSIPTLPIYKIGSSRLGVGTFKEKYLNNLRNTYGLVFVAGYGNTSTDAKVNLFFICLQN